MADTYFRPDGQNRFQIRSAANLSLPSAWLDEEFNQVYVNLNLIQGGGSSATGTEWAEVTAEATQTSTTTFTLTGDYTSTFEQMRAIRLVDGNNASTNSHVKSSSYVGGTNTTTVTVYDAVVPSTIAELYVGLIGTEAQALPTVNSRYTSASLTVAPSDQILLVNDGTIGSLTEVWDDGYVGDTGSYYALLITLPAASYLPKKLLAIKKVGGSYRTIVSAHFVHTTSGSGTSTVHTNTYDFQITGDTSAKNRVTLMNTGDCYWLYSDGTNWIEITPEASETVKGIVRLATTSEMTLTAQQIADGETLRRDLAVSPYQAEQTFLRADSSNLRFTSNIIYKGAQNGICAYADGNSIKVKEGTAILIPNGRDSDGQAQNTKFELQSDITYNASTTTERTYLFLELDSSNNPTVVPVLERNYRIGYDPGLFPMPASGETIFWMNPYTNLLKRSTNSGVNWTTVKGAGPICKYVFSGTDLVLDTRSEGLFLTYADIHPIIYPLARKPGPGYTITSGFVTPTPGYVRYRVRCYQSSGALYFNGSSAFEVQSTGGQNDDWWDSGYVMVDRNVTVTTAGVSLGLFFYPMEGY